MTLLRVAHTWVQATVGDYVAGSFSQRDELREAPAHQKLLCIGASSNLQCRQTTALGGRTTKKLQGCKLWQHCCCRGLEDHGPVSLGARRRTAIMPASHGEKNTKAPEVSSLSTATAQKGTEAPLPMVFTGGPQVALWHVGHPPPILSPLPRNGWSGQRTVAWSFRYLLACPPEEEVSSASLDTRWVEWTS